MRQLTAAEIIDRLDLRPHPEGGHFRETFRDVPTTGTDRSASTAIYYLLARGERSHWHRVDAVEIWHWYAGAALKLEIASDNDSRSTVLGPDLALGQHPQVVSRPRSGKRRKASATGPSSAVRSHPVSTSPPSNWRRGTGRPAYEPQSGLPPNLC